MAHHPTKRSAGLPLAALLAASLGLGASPAPAAPSYEEVTEASGIDFVGSYGESWADLNIMQANMGNGAAAGDIDDDGDIDVYLLGQLGHPNVLYQNQLDSGSKTFVDVTEAAGLGGVDGLSRVAHFVDLDDDGDLDLLLVNDQDEDHSRPPSRIFSNDGDGTFTDVTEGSGFEFAGHLACGTSLADYDLDGDLDIYVTFWTLSSLDGSAIYPGSNRLFRNLGGFRFEDVTEAAGLAGLSRDSFTAIFADFDEDDYPDIYVAIDHSSDEYYRNNRDGTFTNETALVRATHVGNDMGVIAFDFDNDTDLDLFATNIEDPEGQFGGFYTNVLYVNLLQENLGVLRFQDEAAERGVEDAFWGWGTEAPDVENDGDLDIMAVNGFNEYVDLLGGEALLDTPTVLFLNDGDGDFERTLVGPGADSRGLISFDYDRDGDEDALFTNVDQPTRLLENTTEPSGHWLDVAVIQGPGGNRNGIGATIYAVSDGVTRRRDILAGESYLVGTPAEAHFGLGGADRIDLLRVEWTDGSESVYQDLAVDRKITIHQLAGDYDRSGAVDTRDYYAFHRCRWAASFYMHQGRPPIASDVCAAFDFDLDGDLDWADQRALQEAVWPSPQARWLRWLRWSWWWWWLW